MKKFIITINVLCFLISSITIGQITHESNVLSSGGGESSGGNYSHFAVVGEAVVSSGISSGTTSTNVGFIYRNINIQLSGIDLAVFLEGPYASAGVMSEILANNALLPASQPFNTGPWNYAGTESVVTFPAGVVDWVLVELRDAVSPEMAFPSTALDGWPKAMFLKQDGTIVDIDGSRAEVNSLDVVNNLYAVIRHRNHIAIMSSGSLVLTGNTYVYDFTNDLAKAYGAGAGYKEIETDVFGMVAGDADADGNIFMSDRTLWRSNLGIVNSYESSDFDMDGNTYSSDRTLWRANLGSANPITGLFKLPTFVSQVPKEK